ncbi:MAG: PAS domain-containing sensor histidine kinase [Bacteroidota bacterium]
MAKKLAALESENILLKRENQYLKQQVDLLLNQVPVIFYRINKDGVFTDVLGKGLSLLKEQKEDILGNSAFDTEKRWPDLAEAVRDSLKQREAFSRILHTSDGLSYDASQFPVFTSEGEYDGFMGVAFDITPYIKEEKRSNYKDSFLRFFVKHTPAAIAMFDQDMRYIMYSDRWIEDYRLKEVETDLLGQSHYDVFPETPDRWKEVHQRCLRGVTESCEEDPLEREDGTTDYINWVVTPWYTEKNEVGGLIFFHEFVNERVEALQRQKEMAAAVKDSYQRIEDFVYAISQNLQDPLESAMLLIDYLQQHHQNRASGPKVIQFLRIHLARISRIVTELKDYASIEDSRGKRKVDLADVIERVLENLQENIPQGETEIMFENLPEIHANEFEMIALFQHLLGNALRYAGGGGLQVNLSAEQKGENWLIQVKDNGPGISQDRQQELFDVFRTSDSDNSEQGYGISLPMARRIVERMNGKIWVESELGKGSTFLIEFPAIKS